MQSFHKGLFFVDFAQAEITEAISWDSLRRGRMLFALKIPDSSSNSSQYSHSSASSSHILSFAKKSARLLPWQAARKFAPTLVPQRSSCLPSTREAPSPFFSSEKYSLMIRKAKSAVRFVISSLNMFGILPKFRELCEPKFNYELRITNYELAKPVRRHRVSTNLSNQQPPMLSPTTKAHALQFPSLRLAKFLIRNS